MAMVNEQAGGENIEVMADHYSIERQQYQIKIEHFLKPLESKWDFIRDVLLWKKPVVSLCVFVAVNAIFSYFASGHFRMFLIISAIIALGLCLHDVRDRAAAVLERAGITPEERESYEMSLTFNRFCYKLSFTWELVMVEYSNFVELKTTNKKKYYGVIALLVLGAAFAYQYLPLLGLLYALLLFFYLWTPIKYHGTHYVMYSFVEPFFRPFIIQWKNSRTKRERSQIFKAKTGEEHADDSEEEFAKSFHPKASSNKPSNTQPPHEPTGLDSTDGQLISKPRSKAAMPSLLVSETPDPVVLKPLLPTSALPEVQAIPVDDIVLSTSDTTQDDIPCMEDTSSESADLNSLAGLDMAPPTPDDSSISLDSSLTFLPDNPQLPSLSMGGSSTWEYDDDDFTQGLEFPDIDAKEYHSSNESLNDTKTDSTDARPQHTVREGIGSKVTQSAGSSQSSTSTDLSSEYEFLERSEVDEMDSAREAGTTESTVSSYVGQLLGYK
ncbi:uncharacterized protein LOC5521340 [Nematostella vectensis]|uniref:uncharacterized protein LOC5521340 n=1 Tax=Nematostella vectensis TaxID=45351 RepID=UPI0020771191|nr:uncharacterized protein LOC5521340 [Nematostella vectensis]